MRKVRKATATFFTLFWTSLPFETGKSLSPFESASCSDSRRNLKRCGVFDHVWRIEEMVELLDVNAVPAKSGPYKKQTA